MQMTGYELLANYEKAEDKDKQIQILADLNHIPVDMVCFVIDNSEKFDVSETPLSAEEFAKWCETELDRVDANIHAQEKYYREICNVYRIASTYGKRQPDTVWILPLTMIRKLFGCTRLITLTQSITVRTYGR